MRTWMVEPNAVGGWDVRLADQTKVAARASSRAEAEAEAQRLAAAGGEIVVHDGRGRELARHTVAAKKPARAARAPVAGVPAADVQPPPPAPAPVRVDPVIPRQPPVPPGGPTVDELVDDLLVGYRALRAAAQHSSAASVRGLLVRDLVRSAEAASAAVNLHSGDQSAAAQRLSGFLDDLRREDWVKKAQNVAGTGMTLAGLDPAAVVGAVVAGVVGSFLLVAALAAQLFLAAVALGAPAFLLLARVLSAGSEGLERFFATDLPGAGIAARHIAEPERRLHAVAGGRPPMLRVTDGAGHAVKVGVGAFLAAVAVGVVLALMTVASSADPTY